MPQHAPNPRPQKQATKTSAAQPLDLEGAFDEWDSKPTFAQAPTADAITPRQVMALQRMAGNHAVQRLLSQPRQPEAPIQRSPTIIAPLTSAPPSPAPETIQRSPAPKISTYASSAGSTLIQRRTVLASKPGHYHMILGAPQGDVKTKIRQIQKAKRTRKYDRFDDIDISDDSSEHIKDGNGEPVWYRAERSLNVVDDYQYVLANKVLNIPKAPTQQDQDKSEPELDTVSKTDNFDNTGGIVNEVDSALVDVLRGYTIKEDVYEQELSTGEKKITTEGNIAEGAFWATGSGFGMVSGIMGMASSLKDLASDEKSTWEKVEASFNLIVSGSDYLGGGMGVTGGVSQIVASQQVEDSPEQVLSSDLTSWALGLQGMFSSLASAVKTMLDVISLIRMVVREVTDKETFDRDDWLARAGSLLQNALETAKGIVTTYRIMWEFLNDTTTTAFEAVVPGLDIAISAAKSVFQGYYLAKSAYHWHQMAKSSHKNKDSLKAQGFTKESIKESRNFYSEREGLVSNAERRIDKNQKGIAKRTDKYNKGQRKEPSRFGFIEKHHEKQQSTLKKEIGIRAQENQDISQRRDQALQEISDYEQNTIDSSGQQIAQPMTAQQAQQAHPSRLELSELNLSKELSSANAKRVARQAIHIGTNLAKIAGAIVTITAGIGAPAGVALKAAATGIDISLPFFRSLKQYGRKKAGEAQARGEKGVVTKVFNPNKSDIAKLQHRKRQAVTILMMVADLNSLMPTSNDKNTREQERQALTKRVEEIERYMHAAGVSPKKIYRQNGNPAEQIKLLVEAMCKRELL